jgi:hypothetical protein
MTKDTESIFRYAGVSYSHTEQKGMVKCEYMWKHHPTKKVGNKTVWVSNFAGFYGLCRAWSESLPEQWFYLPLTFIEPKF